MSFRSIALLLAVLAATLFAFLFRYEVVAVPAGGTGNDGLAYRLDRWTGELKVIRLNKSLVVIDQP